MQALTPQKQLAQQVKIQIQNYNRFAKHYHAQCFNVPWLEKQLQYSAKQWTELEIGKSTVSVDDYEHALGLIKQSIYDLCNPKHQNKVIKLEQDKPKAHHQHKKTVLNHHSAKSNAPHQINSVDDVKRALRQSHLDQKPSVHHYIITAIQPQKHNSDRFNVFINHHYAFPVSVTVIGQFFLRTGMEVPKALENKIRKADDLSKIVEVGINYLSRTMHTEHQVAQKMYKVTHNQALIHQAIQKLIEYHLLDDKQYAKFYMRDEATLHRQGPQHIKDKLYQKGIHSSVINHVVNKYPKDTQLQNAVKLARHKYQTYHRYAFKQRILHVKAYLMRKGYSSSIINQALSRCHFEPNQNQQIKIFKRKLNLAKRKYGRWKSKNHYKYQIKVKQYLIRQGFSFDMINKYVN